MIFIVNAENRAFFEKDLAQMHRHRKAVFVDRLGWNVPVIDGKEIDAYDRPETVYLIARSEHDSQVLASARLLPTLAPHLMGEVFAHTCTSARPSGANIWEASRFCSSPLTPGRRERLRLLWNMLCAIMETSLLFGIEQIIFTANSMLLPLALECGWQAATLGPTLPDGDDEFTAVHVRITVEGLASLRQRFGIAGPVTRFVTPRLRIAA
jgi:N-acyl-L-homoserine lactone synthetase